MASSIGIKVANGEFYPVIDEGSSIKKRLVVTTVHDNQRSVQIDLYRSVFKSMDDATYIGSLVVEALDLRPRGEPSIELVIKSDGENELDAEAIDLDTPVDGGRQHLTVSLQALDQTKTYEVPDFELEDDEQQSTAPAALYEPVEEPIAEKKSSAPLVIGIATAILVLVLVLLLLWLFVFNKNPKDSMLGKPLNGQETSAPPVVAAPEPEPVPEPEPIKSIETPVKEEAVTEPDVKTIVEKPVENRPPVLEAKRDRPPAPVSRYKVPKVIPKNGYRYKIRWGDTLWDISDAFYKNAWLYPRIARHNKIKNPDLIISGSILVIPPR